MPLAAPHSFLTTAEGIEFKQIGIRVWSATDWTIEVLAKEARRKTKKQRERSTVARVWKKNIYFIAAESIGYDFKLLTAYVFGHFSPQKLKKPGG